MKLRTANFLRARRGLLLLLIGTFAGLSFVIVGAGSAQQRIQMRHRGPFAVRPPNGDHAGRRLVHSQSARHGTDAGQSHVDCFGVY